MKSMRTNSIIQYLTVIDTLNAEKKRCLQSDITKKRKVSPSSGFEAILRLQKKELIQEDDHKHITLTPKGKQWLKISKQNSEKLNYLFQNFFSLSSEQIEQEIPKFETTIPSDIMIELCRFSYFLQTQESDTFSIKKWKAFSLNPKEDHFCSDCIYQSICCKKKEQSAQE